MMNIDEITRTAHADDESGGSGLFQADGELVLVKNITVAELMSPFYWWGWWRLSGGVLRAAGIESPVIIALTRTPDDTEERIALLPYCKNRRAGLNL